ncbi:MAG: hypothetical protein MPK62_14495 [Alphaproteobacteria bacterium]|nr:hypothetical protein [Nitrosopumilus sp.]MDA8032304.1 hypothetical protein [Alphaproteobacteria bacterium]
MPPVTKLEDLPKVAKEIINNIQKKGGRRTLLFMCEQSISHATVMKTNQILRNMGECDGLDLILISTGGDISSAYKIVQTLGEYAGNIRVIVPQRAKSAASLMALGCDELVMCKAGELGPIDPQVIDPQTGSYVPAHSIKETINLISEISDNVVKATLANKISVLLVGSYRKTSEESKQYLSDIFEGMEKEKIDAIIYTFTKKFVNHSHPIDKNMLREIGVEVGEIHPDHEQLVYDLVECCDASCKAAQSSNPDTENALLLLSDDQHTIMIGNTVIAENI